MIEDEWYDDYRSSCYEIHLIPRASAVTAIVAVEICRIFFFFNCLCENIRQNNSHIWLFIYQEFKKRNASEMCTITPHTNFEWTRLRLDWSLRGGGYTWFVFDRRNKLTYHIDVGNQERVFRWTGIDLSLYYSLFISIWYQIRGSHWYKSRWFRLRQYPFAFWNFCRINCSIPKTPIRKLDTDVSISQNMLICRSIVIRRLQNPSEAITIAFWHSYLTLSQKVTRRLLSDVNTVGLLPSRCYQIVQKWEILRGSLGYEMSLHEISFVQINPRLTKR